MVPSAAGLIECVGGPWDGKRVSDRGEAFRLAGFPGTYARFGRVYRWNPEPT